jgi:hypothetical protein
MRPTPKTHVARTKNDLFQLFTLFPLIARKSYWPKISPTLGLVAQTPISIPRPFLGNQLQRIAKFTAHAKD